MASNPAALENSNTSPLGTVLFNTASMVSAWETCTIAVATAFRSVGDLNRISFMLVDSFSIESCRLQKFPCPRWAVQLLNALLFQSRHLSRLSGAEQT